MDRRTFLTGLTAAAVAPALPSIAVGDGVALTTIAHPEAIVDVWLNQQAWVRWPAGALRAAEVGDVILGVAMIGSDGIFKGDLVTLRDGYLSSDSLEDIEIELPER